MEEIVAWVLFAVPLVFLVIAVLASIGLSGRISEHQRSERHRAPAERGNEDVD